MNAFDTDNFFASCRGAHGETDWVHTTRAVELLHLLRGEDAARARATGRQPNTGGSLALPDVQQRTTQGASRATALIPGFIARQQNEDEKDAPETRLRWHA